MELSVVIWSDSDDPYLSLSVSSVSRAMDSIHAELLVADCSLEGIDSSRLSRRYPKVKVVRLEEKRFPSLFAEMVDRCASEYVLWMHSGVVLPENFVSVALSSIQENPDFGSCSGTLLVPGKLETDRMTWLQSMNPNSSVQQESPIEEACWMFRKEAVLKTGMFDREMTESVRDADFLYRMKVNGYQNIRLPLLVLHYKSADHSFRSYQDIHVYFAGLERYLQKIGGCLHTKGRIPMSFRLRWLKFVEIVKLSFRKMVKHKSAKVSSPLMLIFTNESHMSSLRNLCAYNHLEEPHRYILSSEKSVSTLSLWRKESVRPFTQVVFDNSLFSYQKMMTLLEECRNIGYNIGIYDSESRVLISSTRFYNYK